MITSNTYLKKIVLGIILINSCFLSDIYGHEPVKKDSIRNISPRTALIKSAIIPGWGQLYVRKPAKAAIYVTLEAYHIYRMIEYNSICKYIKETKKAIGVDTWNSSSFTEEQKKAAVFNKTDYNLKINTWRAREKRNKYAWWCAGIYFIGMLDAYVDAHLYYFPSENIELAMDTQTMSVGLNFSCNIGSFNGR